MKYSSFLIPILCLTTALSASAQDNILVPENFILHKGDNLSLHLITANQFIKQSELKYDAAKTAKFDIYVGAKKADLASLVKPADSTLVSFKTDNEGLNTISMVRKPILDDIESDDLVKLLEDEGFAQYIEKAKSSAKDSFRERYTWYMKSLIEVEKNSGNNFDKPLNDEYEIVLKDNPYKGNYGDDIRAQVRLKGKPLVNAIVILYVKTLGGNVFAQKLSSDKEGFVYFKLSREGVYLMRSLYIEPSKDKGIDYESWLTSYTFAFSSSNEMPNTYKEFGFGNKH